LEECATSIFRVVKEKYVAGTTCNFFLFDYAEDGDSNLLLKIVKKLPINSVISQ
jgi:hypothetical protein